MKVFIFSRNLCRITLALGSLLAAAAPAHGQGGVPGYPDSVQAYDPREVALLPRYCKYTQVFRRHIPGGNNPDDIKRWFSVYGETFNAMHHYCWGLMKTNRAMLLTRTERYRTFYLNDSILEFDYVLRYTPRGHRLLPELLTKKGENLLHLQSTAQGILALQSAIDLKPDYWPPYAAMSDHYLATGDITKAREVLEKGLSSSPGQNDLLARLTKLDALKDKRPTATNPGMPHRPVVKP